MTFEVFFFGPFFSKQSDVLMQHLQLNYPQLHKIQCYTTGGFFFLLLLIYVSPESPPSHCLPTDYKFTWEAKRLLNLNPKKVCLPSADSHFYVITLFSGNHVPSVSWNSSAFEITEFDFIEGKPLSFTFKNCNSKCKL